MRAKVATSGRAHDQETTERANSTTVLKRTVNPKPTEPKLMSVAGQRPPHSKLTTHLKIFRLIFDSRPKQHTKSLNERAAVETTGIEKAPTTLSAGAVRGDAKRVVRDNQKTLKVFLNLVPC